MRLKGPADERHESTAAVLLIANTLKMFDPLFNGFHVSKHHRRTRLQSQFVCGLHHLQPLIAVNFQRRNFLSHPIHQNFSAPAWNRSESGLFEFRDHFAQGHPEGLREMLKLGRTESMNVDVWIFFPDVTQQIEIPLERQFRMMPPLHQDLNTTNGRKFVQFLIDLLEREHVMIFIFLRSIKRAELAVNIANVRVIDVSIDDVSDDLTSEPVVTFRLCQIAPRISQRSYFF